MPSFPSVTFNIVAPQKLAGVTAHKVLVVGQQLAGGTAVSGEKPDADASAPSPWRPPWMRLLSRWSSRMSDAGSTLPLVR